MYPHENLPVLAKLNHRIMDKVNCLGTTSVPMLRLPAGRFRELLNRVLPEECRIETASDGWYVAAIGAACVMLVFPPAIGALAWCVIQAKKKGGAR